MLTTIPSSITTIAQAKQFLTDLYNNGESYHPDDNTHDIVWSLPIEQRPTPIECEALNNAMEQILSLTDFDAYDFLYFLDPEQVTNYNTDYLEYAEYLQKCKRGTAVYVSSLHNEHKLDYYPYVTSLGRPTP